MIFFLATSHPLPATASLCDAWPDAGSITMRGRVGALIALGAGFNPILTGASGICFGFHRLKREPEGWPPAHSRVLRLGEEARRKSNRRLARRVQHRGRCKSTAAAGRPGGLRDSASGSGSATARRGEARTKSTRRLMRSSTLLRFGNSSTCR